MNLLNTLLTITLFNTLLTVTTNTRNIVISDVVIAAIITGVTSIIVILLKIKGESNNKKNINLLDLEEHPLFARMNILKNYIRSYFVLENKGKEVIFKNILWNYIDIIQEELCDFVKTIKSKKEELSSVEFYNICMNTFQRINDKQNSYYVNNPEYNSKEKDILTKVIFKFNMWNNEHNEYIKTNLEMLCNSCFYTTNIVKASAVLDFYIGVTVHITNNASRTLNSLNGDLEGLVFKGVKVEKNNHEQC